MIQPVRTRTVSTKLTDEEYAYAESASGSLTLSEWVREVILGTRQSKPDPIQVSVVAEVLALRTIVLNTLYKIAIGEQLSVNEMQQLISRADADKGARAAAVLQGNSTRTEGQPPNQTRQNE